MRPSLLTRIVVGCVLLWQGAVSLPAQNVQLHDAPADLERWMYPFNGEVGSRGTASTFAAFSSSGFDTRDGQYLLGWDTSNNIPSGLGAQNYLVRRVRVTLTISRDMAYAYSGALRDYRSYILTNDARFVASTNAYCPVEMYGVGYRGGWTAATFQQTTTFYAGPGPEYTNRTAYAAGYDTNGVLVDVSNNVRDDGTNETANPFEVAPFAVGFATNFVNGQLMPEGSQMVFELNLNDPLIYGYVQQGLNAGSLRLMASSLLNANFFSGTPNYPDFYTKFNVNADPNQYPVLDCDVTAVRTNLDTDANGLPDDWEQFYFTALTNTAAADPDGDGASDLAEYRAGTDPTRSTNVFSLVSLQTGAGTNELRFTLAPSRQYSVLWSDDLLTWQTVTNPAIVCSSAWLSKSETNPAYPSPVFAAWRDTNAMSSKRFYRLGAR